MNSTEHSVTTDTGKLNHRTFISGPNTFVKERRAALKVGDTITQIGRRKVHTMERDPERCTEREKSFKMKERNRTQKARRER